jgi:hypothetical protein
VGIVVTSFFGVGSKLLPSPWTFKCMIYLIQLNNRLDKFGGWEKINT